MNEYWKTRFAWSNSRQKTWDECKKQYYYNYIAKFEGFQGNPLRDKVRELSKLQKLVFINKDFHP